MNAPKVGAYIKSKTIAERAARDWMAANGQGMEFVSVNPSAVLGPLLSNDFSTSIQFVQRLMDGSVPGTPRIGFAVVDVRDLADLHVLALETPGIDGERFIGAGKFFWMREVADLLRARLGPQARKVPKRGIPDFVVRLLALFDPSLRQVTGELNRPRVVSPEHTASGTRLADARRSGDDRRHRAEPDRAGRGEGVRGGGKAPLCLPCKGRWQRAALTEGCHQR